MKKIILASDHGGFELKEQMKEYVKSKGYEVIDLGTNSGTESVSYAEYGLKLGHAIAEDKNALGIGVCGTGLGISYAINRIKGARGARLTTVEDAHLAKEHNNANALVFGGRQISFEEAKAMFDEFVNTEFEGGRHNLRIEQLDK